MLGTANLHQTNLFCRVGGKNDSRGQPSDVPCLVPLESDNQKEALQKLSTEPVRDTTAQMDLLACVLSECRQLPATSRSFRRQ